MKRLFIALLLTILLVLPVFAKQTIFIIDGFTVDTEANTITENGNVYTYVVEGNQVTITYPNGYEYWWHWTDNGGYGGLQADLSAEIDYGEFADGFELVEALESAGENSRSQMGFLKNPQNIAFSILLIPVGIWSILKPEQRWLWKYGWVFKSAEPSDSYLVWIRICGVIAVIFGIVVLFV